jgi:hypothetical protein
MIGVLVCLMIAGTRIPLIRADSSDTTTFDNVCVFTPTSTHLEFNITLWKDWAYEFLFSPYVPNIQYSINIHLTAPSSLIYHLIDYSEVSNTSYPTYNITYIPAETGSFRVQYDVVPNRNLNMYLAIHPLDPLIEYYSSLWYDQNAYAPANSLYLFNSTFVFSNAQKAQNISLTFENNTEYWVDCFRTNPIPNADILADNYPFPNITLNLWQQGIDYVIYDHLLSIKALTSNDSFRIRFGSAYSGSVTAILQIDQSIYNVNFAFICYSIRRVGSASPGSNGTSNSNTTNTTSTSSTNSTINFNGNQSVFDQISTSVNSWVNSNIDNVLLYGGGVLGILMVVDYYGKSRKATKSQSTPNPRSDKVVDNSRGFK